MAVVVVIIVIAAALGVAVAVSVPAPVALASAVDFDWVHIGTKQLNGGCNKHQRRRCLGDHDNKSNAPVLRLALHLARMWLEIRSPRLVLRPPRLRPAKIITT